jgi:hypothetical protein
MEYHHRGIARAVFDDVYVSHIVDDLYAACLGLTSLTFITYLLPPFCRPCSQSLPADACTGFINNA